MLQTILFLVSLTSAMSMLGICLYSLLNPKFRFWPPPSTKSWQRKVFFIFFRTMLYCLIFLTVLKLSSEENLVTARLFIGAALTVVGFGAAFASTIGLGWKNAFGDKKGLVRNGWFRFSRNPVYLVTWIGMIGWSVIASKHWQISIILAIWATVYLFAIFLEERWLEEVYGKKYTDYKSSTARFLSLRPKK